MKNFAFGVVLTILILFSFKYCTDSKQDKQEVMESTLLIQERLKNVSKLVVSEGHFSQVFNYKNSRELLGEYLTSDKTALVVVNADVTIAFDLSKIEYKIDESTKTVRITYIPKEEITISPDLEYYDVESGFLNPFDASDYNKIKRTVKDLMLKKVQQSTLISNAENRLITELSKFYILVNTLGWTLEYNSKTVEDIEGLDAFVFPDNTQSVIN